MAGLSLAQAQANLDAANTAYAKSLEAEAYSEGSRSVRRDPAKLLDALKYWERRVQTLTQGSGPRVRGATPL